jgi:hypothetical protein
MPSRLGAQSSESNEHEMCQPSEEQGALEMGNQLTTSLQTLSVKPQIFIENLNPCTIG